MYSESRLMRGDFPPRTSELIFEMLKMLTLHEHWSKSVPGHGLVVVAGDDGRRIGGEFRDALEDVLGRVGREVGDQLVVDRQVRRQHEEVVEAVRQVQVADEGAHQPGLAHAGGQRKTERGKIALEIGHRRVFAANRLQRDIDSRLSWAATISVMRSRISSERRCGGRRLRRPAMALTWRFMASSAGFLAFSFQLPQAPSRPLLQ